MKLRGCVECPYGYWAGNQKMEYFYHSQGGCDVGSIACVERCKYFAGYTVNGIVCNKDIIDKLKEIKKL